MSKTHRASMLDWKVAGVKHSGVFNVFVSEPFTDILSAIQPKSQGKEEQRHYRI